MKLFTKQIDNLLFAQYKFGNDLSKQKVAAKIFNPYGKGVWYLLNSDPQDPDYIWAIVDLASVEIGSVSRKQLENLKVPPFRLHLERDSSFIPLPANEVYVGVINGKRFEDGGEVNDENVEMLRNQAHTISHHSKEFTDITNKTTEAEPWVITKANRASTDLSDITHYLEGQASKMADGGMMAKGGSVWGKNGFIEYQIDSPQEWQNVEWSLNGHSPSFKGKMYFQKGSRFMFIEKENGEIYEPKPSNKLFWRPINDEMADGGMMPHSGNYLVMYYKTLVTSGGKMEQLRDTIKLSGSLDDVIEKVKTALGSQNYDNASIIDHAKNTIKAKVKKDGQVMKYEDGGMMAEEGEYGVDKHRIYFQTFGEVMSAIHDIAEDNGYEVVDIFPDLSYGGVSYGETRRASVELVWNGKEKRGKSKKREKNTLNVQIYRMDSGNYELNTYFSYASGGMMEDGGMMAKGGMIVTSIKEIPNFKQRLEERKITYRGLGMGKKSDDFYDLAGENGKSIKVDGKEYYITDTEFDSFSRGSDGKLIVRFDAPYKKSYADGGMMADGGIMAKGGENDIGYSIILKPMYVENLALFEFNINKRGDGNNIFGDVTIRKVNNGWGERDYYEFRNVEGFEWVYFMEKSDEDYISDKRSEEQKNIEKEIKKLIEKEISKNISEHKIASSGMMEDGGVINGEWVVYNPNDYSLISTHNTHMSAKIAMKKLWHSGRYDELGIMTQKEWSEIMNPIDETESDGDMMADGGMMAKGGVTKKDEILYIEYLNKDKKYTKDKKVFKGQHALKDAIAWGKQNLSNFNIDMVKYMMADGGQMEDDVDLFEDYENIPENVQSVLDKYAEVFEEGDYEGLKKVLSELEMIGYTFEYDLDGQAYNLRKL